MDAFFVKLATESMTEAHHCSVQLTGGQHLEVFPGGESPAAKCLAGAAMQTGNVKG